MKMSRSFAAAFALSGLCSVVSASIAGAASCDITFRVGTSTPMSSASVFAIYTGAPGDFPGTSTSVDCDLLNGTLGSVADAENGLAKSLQIVLIGTPNAIQGPKDVVRCTWIPTSRFPVAGDFNLSSQSGFNTSLPFPSPVNANFTVSDIDCTGTITTTTTTTTTTSSTTSSTLPAPACGDFDNNTKIQTSDALNILKVSVGQKECLVCVCDVDGSGAISTVDALVTLRKAVGTGPALACGACN